MNYTTGETEAVLWINSIACLVSLLVEFLYFYITIGNTYLLSNPKNRMIHFLMISNTITVLSNIPPYITDEVVVCTIFSFVRHYGNVCGIMFVAAIARASYLQLSVHRTEMPQVYQRLTLVSFIFPAIWAGV